MNHDLDALTRLVDYHDHIAGPPVHVADDLRRGRRRVRRNRGLVAGGVAIGLASVVAAVSLITGERSADRLQPADSKGLTTPLVAPKSLLDVRELGFHVEPGPGFDVSDSWAIDRDQQKITVAFGDGDLELDVAVNYQGRSPDKPTAGTREAVTVNGVPGTYVLEFRPDYWAAHLAWEYAPNSWAEVYGRGFSAPADLRNKLLTVAEAVRSGGKPVRVPVRLGSIPPSLPSVETAHSVNMGEGDGEWQWRLEVGDISIWATSRVGEACLGSDGRPQTAEFTYRGHDGCVVAGERVGLRLGDADAFFDFGPSPELPLEDMKQVLAELTIAPDDPTTWFDLKTALGG